MQREREKELLFRGAQIKDAIARWNKGGAGVKPMPLSDLKALLKDPRSTSSIRYLRRLYTDPLTNKEWTQITDQSKGIIGVQSTSEEQPLKQDFSDYPADSTEFKMFGGKKKYSEWLFVPDELQNLVANQTVTTGPKPNHHRPPANYRSRASNGYRNRYSKETNWTALPTALT